MPTVSGTTSHGKTTSSQASLTIAHTATGDPLCVGIGLYNSPVRLVQTVTYGGVALSQLKREVPASSVNAIEWWILAAPPIGLANLVVTADNPAFMGAVVRNVSGGNLYAATGTAARAATPGTTPSVAVPSAVGALVLDLVISDSSNQTFTVGAGQTLDAAQNGQVNSDAKVAASQEPGAASVTMSWTLSASDLWTTAGLSIPVGTTVAPGVFLGTPLFFTEDQRMKFNVYRAITPSDTVDLSGLTDAIYAGGAGTIAAVSQGGQVTTFTVPAGAWIPIAAKRINASGTTATGLVALGGA